MTTRGFRWLDNSRMDFKLGARMLAKYPALSLIGGVGQAVGVAIGAGFFAFFYSFLYATLPVEGGERIVALENWDIDANDEMRRSMHDLVMWQREMTTARDNGRSPFERLWAPAAAALSRSVGMESNAA